MLASCSGLVLTLWALVVLCPGSDFNKAHLSSWLGGAYLLSVCCFTPLVSSLSPPARLPQPSLRPRTRFISLLLQLTNTHTVIPIVAYALLSDSMAGCARSKAGGSLRCSRSSCSPSARSGVRALGRWVPSSPPVRSRAWEEEGS